MGREKKLALECVGMFVSRAVFFSGAAGRAVGFVWIGHEFWRFWSWFIFWLGFRVSLRRDVGGK